MWPSLNFCPTVQCFSTFCTLYCSTTSLKAKLTNGVWAMNPAIILLVRLELVFKQSSSSCCNFLTSWNQDNRVFCHSVLYLIINKVLYCIPLSCIIMNVLYHIVLYCMYHIWASLRHQVSCSWITTKAFNQGAFLLVLQVTLLFLLKYLLFKFILNQFQDCCFSVCLGKMMKICHSVVHNPSSSLM